MAPKENKKQASKKSNVSEQPTAGGFFVDVFPVRVSPSMTGGTVVGQIAFSMYFLVGVYLFATGSLPMFTSRVNFLGDKLAMAFAAWKMAGLVFIVMCNLKFPLHISNSVFLLLSIGIDLASLTMDGGSWNNNGYGWSIVALDVCMLLASLSHRFVLAGLSYFAYAFSGLLLFTMGTLPILAHHLNPLQKIFAGWRFCLCLYFALVNIGVNTTIMNFATMAFILGVDMVAVEDTYTWKEEGWGGSNLFFAVHISLCAYHQFAMLHEASSNAAKEGTARIAQMRQLKAAKAAKAAKDKDQ